jgi:16S rRNA (guanine527-N7)-methyltransferase
LPGLVLAMACPALQVTLVDAVRKKTVFLRQAVIELGLSRVEIRHERVENLTGSYGLIVSRAFAELKDFVALTRHLVAPGGYWLAMKGQKPERELAALPDDIRAVAVEPLKIPGLAAERHLLVLRVAA